MIYMIFFHFQLVNKSLKDICVLSIVHIMIVR